MVTDPTMAATIAGFAVGLGLVLSVGPQNLHLIRAGAMRQHGFATATSGFLSEVLIVVATIAWLGSALDRLPDVAVALQVLGAGFLTWCGVRTLARRKLAVVVPDSRSKPTPLRQSVAMMLCVTWLNPLVYLEVGLVAGSVSLGFDDILKAPFALGLLLAAAIKFYGWTMFGRSLSTLLATTEKMAWFNLASGWVLLLMASGLVWHGMS